MEGRVEDRDMLLMGESAAGIGEPQRELDGGRGDWQRDTVGGLYMGGLWVSLVKSGWLMLIWLFFRRLATLGFIKAEWCCWC